MDIKSFMPEEVECYEALRQIRWPDGVRCVKCGSDRVVKTGKWRNTPNQRYHCKDCDAWFNEKSGTVFESSRTELRYWFFIAFLMQFKVSVLEISRTLNMRYATVFELVKKLRQSVYAKAMVERLKGEVEIDEVYIKAGLKGRKKMKRGGRKRGLKARGRGTYDSDKVPVVAMVERGGKIRIRPHRNIKTKEIIDRYLSDVDPGAIVYTDDFSSYNALPSNRHRSINHSDGEYSDGNGVHINTVEAEFSVYRPWMAIFRGVSKERLYLYCSHYELLRNNRRSNPVDRMLEMVKFLRLDPEFWTILWFYDKGLWNNWN